MHLSWFWIGLGLELGIDLGLGSGFGLGFGFGFGFGLGDGPNPILGPNLPSPSMPTCGANITSSLPGYGKSRVSMTNSQIALECESLGLALALALYGSPSSGTWCRYARKPDLPAKGSPPSWLGRHRVRDRASVGVYGLGLGLGLRLVPGSN